jgi:hypothetical protein
MLRGDRFFGSGLAWYDKSSNANIYIDGHPAASSANIEAKENVRRSVDAIAAADLEHGAGIYDH